MSHLSTRVDAAIVGLSFTSPIDLADVQELHRRITLALAPGERLEVYHRIREVVVEVRELIGASVELTYRRVLEVS